MNLPFLGFSPFSLHPAVRVCFFVAVLLSATMALISDHNRHPDEIHHLKAAEYYCKAHVLPPEIGDPAVRDSYSSYGVSYLNYHWAEYFFAGKFMLLISPVIQDKLMAARFFSVFLFALLSAWFCYRSRNDRTDLLIVPSFLLITPQIWYVFSYVNNDALALFISIVAAHQIAYPQSLLNEFFESRTSAKGLFGGIAFGLMAGLLLILKPNYWTFLIFAALWLLNTFPFTLRNAKKCAFLFMIPIAVLSFRVGLDLYVNGETNFVGFSYVNKFLGNLEKGGKLLAYQEEVAEYAYRPSTLENDLMNSHYGLKLKDKGTSLVELFTKWKWHESSFSSFVGVYNYMNIWARGWYYKSTFLLYLAFFGYLVFAVIRRGDRQSIVQLVIVSSACFLTVFVSIMLSWIYAFQAQGRYLFPVIGMIGIFAYANRKHFHNFIVHLFLILAFLMSLYSFIFVGLMRINTM